MIRDNLIEIGHSRIIDTGVNSRLISDIKINGDSRCVYFEVDSKYKDCLTISRADPFLVLMINYALFTKKNIVCHDPVDENLLYGLRKQYIKTLCNFSDSFFPIEIEAKSTSIPYKNKKKVGAAMTFGCDSLYTFNKNYKLGEFPITHLCIFNNGALNEDLEFTNQKTFVSKYSNNKGLEFVFVDSNIHKVFSERYLDIYSQRNIACVLALQGLFSTYFYASGHDDDHFYIDPHNSASYDLLSVENFSTKRLNIILSGNEVTRVEKLRYLLDFEDTYHFLHPCFKQPVNLKNCGHCQKDIREMVLFYAWGKQKEFSEIYDFTDFEKRLPMCLGILIALSNQHLYKEVLVEYTKLGFSIPFSSYKYAEIYKKLLDNKK